MNGRYIESSRSSLRNGTEEPARERGLDVLRPVRDARHLPRSARSALVAAGHRTEEKIGLEEHRSTSVS